MSWGQFRWLSQAVDDENVDEAYVTGRALCLYMGGVSFNQLCKEICYFSFSRYTPENDMQYSPSLDQLCSAGTSGTQ